MASCAKGTEVVREGNSLALDKLSLGTKVAFGQNSRSGPMSRGTEVVREGNSLASENLHFGAMVAFG